MQKLKYSDLIYSWTAAQRGINNMPGVDVNADPILTRDYIFNNLVNLAKKVIYPIYRGLGQDHIILNSIYRSKVLNGAIGGADNSAHVHGCAVDLLSTKISTAEIYNWCSLNLPVFNQLIWEYPERASTTQLASLYVAGDTDDITTNLPYEINITAQGEVTDTTLTGIEGIQALRTLQEQEGKKISSWVHISYGPYPEDNKKLRTLASEIPYIRETALQWNPDSDRIYANGNYVHHIGPTVAATLHQDPSLKSSLMRT